MECGAQPGVTRLAPPTWCGRLLCVAVPLYRLIFPPRPGDPIEDAPSAEIDSGDEVYAVGAELIHEGKRWRVTEVPLETQDDEEPADLLLWPAD